MATEHVRRRRVDRRALRRDVHRRLARDRRGDRRGPAGLARGRAARDRRGEPRGRRVGATDGVRARRGDASRRRRDREAPRRARAHADARPGQAAARVARRGRGADRLLAQRRRGRQAARGAPRELVHGGQARAARAPAARRDRRDHAVELAVHDARRADRACARVGQHRRLDAGVVDGGRRRRAGAVRRRGRPAAGRVQPRHRAGLGRRRRDRAQPGTHGVGFIGSTETGRKVAEAAAGKAAVLELGGNGPVVVLEDADLDLAAEATVTACFLCAGQSCTAGERLLVHGDVREEFVARCARSSPSASCSAIPSPTARRWGR